MPVETKDVERFVSLSEAANVCQIKRAKDFVKLKLRTPKTLYTLKVEPEEAEEIIKKLKCQIAEV